MRGEGAGSQLAIDGLRRSAAHYWPVGRAGVAVDAEPRRSLCRRGRQSWTGAGGDAGDAGLRSEEHTSELQSLMRISYAAFFLKKKTEPHSTFTRTQHITRRTAGA